MKPLVWAVDSASVAASRVGTIQDVLHTEVDVHSLALTGDLDSVPEGRDGTVCPATSTILRHEVVTKYWMKYEIEWLRMGQGSIEDSRVARL